MIDVGILSSNPRFVINAEKDCTITKFLNRILGLEVHQQNYLFQYFMDNFEHLIEKDKKDGKYDMGILGEWLVMVLKEDRRLVWSGV